MRAAMSAVQEQMQHGAQEKQYIRQNTDDVRAVFQNQEERRNSQEREEDQSTWRSEPAALL
jgi:hypothetical protein